MDGPVYGFRKVGLFGLTVLPGNWTVGPWVYLGFVNHFNTIFAINIILIIIIIISGVQWYNGPLPLLPLGQPQPVQHEADLQWEEERPTEVQRPPLLWHRGPTQLWSL